jgi:sialate O-acetylesterase
MRAGAALPQPSEQLMTIHFPKTVLPAVLLTLVTCTVWADVRLPAILSDNMVLEKGVPIAVRGWADPAEKISVEFCGQRKVTTAAGSGNWSVTLDPLAQASTPAEMQVKGRNTVRIRNVVIGDVWLASGQSNMEMPVNQVQNAAQEIQAANYPNLRVFMVEHDLASSPKDDCSGKWLVCTPKNAGVFSAVAYFFARELHTKYGVPMGVINSSVGSSSCEAWTPADVLQANPALPRLATLDAKDYGNWKTYETFRRGVYDRHCCKDPGVKAECLAWARPDGDTSDWKDVEVPGSFESRGMNIDGAVWFRKEVDVPAGWAGHALSLYLGPISDNDVVFMNGQKVGATENRWRTWVFRTYTIPPKLVRPGRNVVAVRIFNAIGPGGFSPTYPAPLKLSKDQEHAIVLTGKWKSRVEVAMKPAKLPFPVPTPYTIPTAFFNAMIAPLTHFPVRGFIWYQGETNAGAPRQHDILFPAMIESWRKLWGNPTLPFYFVQLAGFRARQSQPSEAGWAPFRESQLKTLALRGTGMAVAIDIGDATNVHPKNKQDVGRRLARWAIRDCYGDRQIEVSGPLYASRAIEGDRIRIRFTHVGGGLKVRGQDLKGFAIAGADKRFVWAQATVEGDSVVVWSDSVNKPLYVRYAWADNPECNLYNRADLPASPFRTDTF